MSFYSCIKPKTIINSPQIQPLDRMELFFAAIDGEYALFQKGLEVWKKYEERFCGNNIFFVVFEQDQELHFVQVAVFNKRLMVSIFDRYCHKFSDLRNSIKPSESLFNLLLKDQAFKEKFYSREDLLGLCLGYGEKNAALFQKMATLLATMRRQNFTLQKPSPDCSKDAEQELIALERIFTGGINLRKSRKFFFNIGLGFRADFSDPETLFLQKKYDRLHKELTRAYKGVSFLEKTLELISIQNENPVDHH